jgi:hypothetical protein
MREKVIMASVLQAREEKWLWRPFRLPPACGGDAVVGVGEVLLLDNPAHGFAKTLRTIRRGGKLSSAVVSLVIACRLDSGCWLRVQHGKLECRRGYMALLPARERQRYPGLALTCLFRDPHGAVELLVSAAMAQRELRAKR